MRLATFLLLLFPAVASAQTNKLGLIGFTTNRFTNVISVLSVTQLPGLCPECGMPNHHERRIEHVSIHESVRGIIVYNDQTNMPVLYTSPITIALQTNIVFREMIQPTRRSPGWPATNYPPLP